jgi:hypothetical protein
MTTSLARYAAALALSSAALACTDHGANDAAPSHTLTGPETDCASCHPKHVQDWTISSHAYAIKDPVFDAMVRVGQRDTGGKLGNFCVQCHTPVGNQDGETPVVKDPATGDFTQSFVGKSNRTTDGVSCLACHSISSISGAVNAEFTLTLNDTRRGPIFDPDSTAAHHTQFDDVFENAKLCGTCHVVVNPNDVALERTYIEWVQSGFNGAKSCQDCHMPSSDGQAAVGHRERTVHDHAFVGVDVSLLPEEDFPGYEEMRSRAETLLKSSVTFSASLDPTTRHLGVTIVNNAGHALPSGAVADRQMWVELVVKDDAGNVAFESGTPDPNGDLRVSDPDRTTEPGTDPSLVSYGQEMLFDPKLAGASADAGLVLDASTASPHPVDFLWEPNKEVSHLIGVSQSDTRSYDLSALSAGHYAATARLLFRAFSPHVLRRLEQLGGLSPDVRKRLPTVEMATASVGVDLP